MLCAVLGSILNPSPLGEGDPHAPPSLNPRASVFASCIPVPRKHHSLLALVAVGLCRAGLAAPQGSTRAFGAGEGGGEREGMGREGKGLGE